ncbi:MAG: hypothetical protein U9N34_07695, partial [Candidatus Cloacimonadota bacterium]|nr:hypothetical protein [Candidatus Cloacimonadota bacterium]
KESVSNGWDIIKKNQRKCEAIADIDNRSKSNTHRLDNLESLAKDIHVMSTNLTNLTSSIAKIVDKVDTHDTKIYYMENKIDDVGMLKNDVKEVKANIEKHTASFTKKVHELESINGEDAKELLNKIKWLLISTMIGSALYIVWQNIGG